MLSRVTGRVPGGPRRAPDEVHEAEGDLQFERVVFFSDAVFAIAATLLIIDLKVPDNLEGDLVTRLMGGLVGARVQAFIISFLLICSYWVAHHRHFRYIKRYDARLVWLNLFFLMSVVFLPFVTSLIGEYGNQRNTVILYAISVAITGLMLALQ